MPRIKQPESKRYSDILESNKQDIKDFLIHISTKSKPLTVRSKETFLLDFARAIKKDFMELTRRDIDRYLSALSNRLKPSSIEMVKTTLRLFFQWLYNCDKGQYPDVVRHVEYNYKALQESAKGEEAVLTPEEIEKLIEAPPILMHKAMIETFVVTGCRVSELAHFNVGDIKEEDGVIWFNIKRSMKTGKPRKIPVVPNQMNPTARYPKYLLEWLKIHPQKNNPDTPLFLSSCFTPAYNGKRILRGGVEGIVARTKKFAGIDRYVTPHILRHTSATNDGSYLTEADMCQKYGWVIGSNMAGRYVHTNADRLAKRQKELAGIKDTDATTKPCPRCGESNSMYAEICSKCQQILSHEALMKELEKRKEQEKEIAKLKDSVQMLHIAMKNILGYEIQDEIDRRYAEEQEQLIRKEVEEELIKKQT